MPVKMFTGVICMNGEAMTNEELTRVYNEYRDMVYRIALTKPKAARRQRTSSRTCSWRWFAIPSAYGTKSI